MAGALAGKAPVLAWLKPVDLFFLQVQGSGILAFPDGHHLNLGFAGTNEQPYVAIGPRMRARGDIPAGAGMAEIRAWLAAYPDLVGPTLAENPRYVFFRALPPDAPFPVGALGTRLVARADAAVDPAFVPPGALLHLATRIGSADFAGLVLASDRGAAIQGANRIDLYMGEGDAAGAVAGALQAPGDSLLLLPRATAARLGAAR
jgi:membrane-bound lytic murein transglycosylase A